MYLPFFPTRARCYLMFRLLSGPSLKSCILSVVSQPVLLHGYILFQVQDLAFVFVQLWEVAIAHFFSLLKTLWIAALLWSAGLRGWAHALSRSLIESRNCTGLSIDPWGMPPVTNCSPWNLTIQLIFHSHYNPFIQFISHSLGFKHTVGDSVTSLAEVKVYNSHCFSLIGQANHIIREGNQVVQTPFAHNLCWQIHAGCSKSTPCLSFGWKWLPRGIVP